MKKKNIDVHPKRKAKNFQTEITKNERGMKYFSGTDVKSESIHLRSTIGLGCDVFGHLVQAASNTTWSMEEIKPELDERSSEWLPYYS